MAVELTSLIAVASVGNMIGIGVAATKSGPGNWLKERVLDRWGDWRADLVRCAVCMSFWGGTVAGAVAFGFGGGIELLSAGCVAMTAQYGFAVLGKRTIE